MPEWREQVGRLLHDGERVEEAVEWEAGAVVLTGRRVLVFTPEMDGANFSQVDRPNVDGISSDALATASLLGRVLRFGVYGVILLVAGTVVDFGDLVGGVDLDSEALSAVGGGGIFGLLRGMLDLLARLDELLRLAGALVLVLSAVLLAVYWVRRTPTLAIHVAGGDDIHVPRPEEETARKRLRTLLTPGDQADDGGLVARLAGLV